MPQLLDELDPHYNVKSYSKANVIARREHFKINMFIIREML